MDLNGFADLSALRELTESGALDPSGEEQDAVPEVSPARLAS